MKDLDDQDLLRALATDPNGALRELQGRYEGLILSYILKAVNRSDAPDVSQMVWLSVLQKWQRYDPAKGTLRMWLSSLARNKAIDWARSRAGHARLMERLEVAFQPDEVYHVSTDDDAADRERGRNIGAALDELPEGQREVVVLHYYSGMSHRQISRHLSLPLGTVKTRLEGAIQKLGGLLQQV